MKTIILASKSPRRRELLAMLGVDFTVKASSVEEVFDHRLSPEEVVKHLSKIKAQALGEEFPNQLVIGADTIVVSDGKLLGKPRDKDDAYHMLKQLSGNEHDVMTGVTIYYQHNQETFYKKTRVTFYPLSDEEILHYINTNEPYDKAGAYAVQGKAAKFIESIEGDYYTVVGLPISELYQRLKKYDLFDN